MKNVFSIKSTLKLGLLSIFVITMISCNSSKKKLGVHLIEFGGIGVEIGKVYRNTIAEIMNLQPGDVIYKFNDNRVYNIKNFRYYMKEVLPGSKLTISFIRNEEKESRTVIVSGKPKRKCSCSGNHKHDKVKEKKLKLIKIIKEEEK